MGDRARRQRNTRRRGGPAPLLEPTPLECGLAAACESGTLPAATVVAAVRAVAATSRREGFVFSQQRKRELARLLVKLHGAWSTVHRASFLLLLATQLADPLAGPIDSVLAQWRRDGGSATDLRARLVPVHELFFKFVSSQRHGSAWLIDLRGELRWFLSAARRLRASPAAGAGAGAGAGSSEDPAAAAMRVVLSGSQPQALLGKLRELDTAMRDMFTTQQGMQLRRVTRPEDALLKYIIEKEAVHPVRGAMDIQRRLHGKDRYCYGLFHPGMRTRPLAFVYVALSSTMSSNIEHILSGKAVYRRPRRGVKASPPVAVFYSVTNSMRGLQGLQLASFLLFLAMDRIREEYDGATFVTLSPVPGFRRWLTACLSQPVPDILLSRSEQDCIQQLAAMVLPSTRAVAGANKKGSPNTLSSGGSRHVLACRALLAVLEGRKWVRNDKARALLRPVLLRIAGRYLMFERRGRKALDQVGNFHVQNGATIERINFGADLSERGVAQSFGLMVNYRYNPRNVQALSAAYKRHSVVAASGAALLLQSMGDSMFEGLDEDTLAAIDIPVHARVYEPGSVVATPHDPDSAGIYFVSFGTVRVTQGAQDEGAGAPTHNNAQGGGGASRGDSESCEPRGAGSLVHAGHMFGHEAVLMAGPWTLAAVAVTKVHVFVHPAEPFRRLLDSNASVRQTLMSFARRGQAASGGEARL